MLRMRSLANESAPDSKAYMLFLQQQKRELNKPYKQTQKYSTEEILDFSVDFYGDKQAKMQLV